MIVPSAAATGKPLMAIATSSPVVFSATVLPPAFGPLITSAVLSRSSFDRDRHHLAIRRLLAERLGARRREPLVEQRMASVDDFELVIVVERRPRRADREWNCAHACSASNSPPTRAASRIVVRFVGDQRRR